MKRQEKKTQKQKGMVQTRENKIYGTVVSCLQVRKKGKGRSIMILPSKMSASERVFGRQERKRRNLYKSRKILERK